MKRLLTAVLAFLLCAGAAARADVAIDGNSFPDAVFRAYIAENFDSDHNGSLSEAEIDGVDSLYVSKYDLPSPLASLKGIEFFPHLSNLACAYNNLTELDVSRNPELVLLACQGNRLTDLNVRGNPLLQTLQAEQMRLTSLDVSLNPELSILIVGSNSISQLDLSHNPKLEYLDVFRNPLTALDLSRQLQLSSLLCAGNASGFTLTVAPDSFALSYAVENSIPYVVAGSEEPAGPEEPGVIPGPDPSYAGVYNLDGALVMVQNGQVDASAEGLVNDLAHPSDWYYCSAGIVHTEVTSVVLYDGAWFYVSGGKLDTTFAGFVDYDGERFVVGAGRILTEAQGLVQDPASKAWYYCGDGRVQSQYTGLAQYDGAWFYIVGGRLDEGFTGTVEYDGALFSVVNGMVAG
ncbi:MAG: hypothetical protein J5602_00215 [Clostridia bacterium]|nr:hypothetical protein [Clostridia bacterium]